MKTLENKAVIDKYISINKNMMTVTLIYKLLRVLKIGDVHYD